MPLTQPHAEVEERCHSRLPLLPLHSHPHSLPPCPMLQRMTKAGQRTRMKVSRARPRLRQQCLLAFLRLGRWRALPADPAGAWLRSRLLGTTSPSIRVRSAGVCVRGRLQRPHRSGREGALQNAGSCTECRARQTAPSRGAAPVCSAVLPGVRLHSRGIQCAHANGASALLPLSLPCVCRWPRRWQPPSRVGAAAAR